MTVRIDCTTPEKLEAFGRALSRHRNELVVNIGEIAREAGCITLTPHEEAVQLLSDLNELFYAEEGESGNICIKADHRLVQKVESFVARYGNQKDNPRVA